MNLVSNRPAETGGVLSAIAFLLCYVLGLDDAGVLAAIGTVVGFVPAAITWLVVTIRGPQQP